MTSGFTVTGVEGATVMNGLGTGYVDLNLGTIPADGSVPLAVTDKAGTVTPYARVSLAVRSTGDGQSDGVLKPFGPPASYSIQVTDGTTARLRMVTTDATEWMAGPGTYVHTVTMRNDGPDAFSVRGRLQLQRMADGVITSAQVTGGTCAPDTSVGAGSWSCDIGPSIPVGATIVATVNGRVDTTQTVAVTTFGLDSNSYTGPSYMGQSGRVSQMVATSVDADQADLSITASHVPTAAPGALVPVTLTIRNNGPLTATDVEITGRLLNNLTMSSASPECLAGRMFTCFVGDIPAGGTRSVTLNVAGVTAGPRGMLTASATSAQGEYVWDDNTVYAGMDIAIPAPPPVTTPPPAPAPPPPPPPAAPAPLPLMVGATVTPFPTTRIAAAVRSGVPATVRTDRAATVLVRVYLPVTTARTAFRMKVKAPVLIGVGRRTVAARTPTTVRAILTPAWKKRLAGRKTVVTLQQRIDVSATKSTTRVIRRGIRLR